MFLAIKKYFLMFFILFLFSCSKNESQKLRITIFNSGKYTVFFDKPRVLFIENSSDGKKKLYTVNKNINIVEKLRQYDEEHGTKTYINTSPCINLVELKPNFKTDFFIDCKNESKIDYSEHFAIFHINNEITTATYYEYDNYVSDMLKNGFISLGAYDSDNKTIYFDLARNPRKMTELAYRDFETFLETNILRRGSDE
ncbi:MAG: hypothetical protein J5965_07040 [Aeriscardovia sp.]|nr:hypothetical protein [Aeriscardovia sp.]MBP3283561.1 hypothetical protein [Treponema sp.]